MNSRAKPPPPPVIPKAAIWSGRWDGSWRLRRRSKAAIVVMATGQVGATGVGTEIALPAEPHDDERGQYPQHNLGRNAGDPIADSRALVLLIAVSLQGAVDCESGQAWRQVGARRQPDLQNRRRIVVCRSGCAAT
jgi:hypothetical protein